ncbi:MAG: flavodoxin family protein [Coriobacteriales bacterium]
MSRKILVVIGSPRKGGNTTILAEAFARGAREAGHEVEFVDSGRAKIAGCLGCEYCFKPIHNFIKCTQF